MRCYFLRKVMAPYITPLGYYGCYIAPAGVATYLHPPSLGGGEPRSSFFRATCTGRLYPATTVSHHAINTAMLQKPQIPNGQWRGSPIGQKSPNRHELKGKTGPQHPPPGWGPKHPQCSIFDLMGSQTRVGGWVLFCSTRVL